MSNVSTLANTLIPSEIIKLGNEISEKIRQGNSIYNFTIGDFDPSIFPIPSLLEEEIIKAYQNKKTNYPPASGISELRNEVAAFIKRRMLLDYDPSSILISGGGRPLIYAAYLTICDEGEKIIYPVPSWNNNHYTHFVNGKHICIETSVDNNFLPTAEELIPHFKEATLLALCSPLNPTGTLFSKEQLTKICEAVIEENKGRTSQQKPLYILFDQIYWTLTYGDAVHYDPVSLFPELTNYTIFVDGISKAFCATGVRVGWAFGPIEIIDKMKGILSHIGAWSPMAEQVATAKFLRNESAVDEFLLGTRNKIEVRLRLIYEGIMELKNEGFPIDAISPTAAMYLAIKFPLKNKRDDQGELIVHTATITSFLLNSASLALVPFSAFGANKESEWYRLSVGTCPLEEIPIMLKKLRSALELLS
nr:aminotransferase class I/II-fold pyridoxal phosphate-dependent enzyme [Chitinophagaceae bacterium]